MATFTHQNFTGQRIVSDGNTYERCVFKNCVFVFQGGAPPSLVDCSFDGSQFSFDGAAANTATFFRALARDPGMRVVLSHLLPELFHGT